MVYSGSFGPKTLTRLRELTAQHEALQRQISEIVFVTIEAWGHDLDGELKVTYNVSGGSNEWEVVRVQEDKDTKE